MSNSHRASVNLDAWPPHVQHYVDEKIRERGVEAFPDGRDRFEHVTSDVLSEALADFRLKLGEGRTLDWLVAAVRKTLALATPLSTVAGDNAQPNAKTRERLLAAARHLERAAMAIGDLNELDLEPVAAGMAATPLGVFPFNRSRVELEYLADSFRITCRHLKVAGGPIRAAAARELAIRRAYYVAPIFERAYGKPATVNDYPGRCDLGPWADWFERIIRAATDERVHDLRRVLKEARRRYLGRPPEYPENWLGLRA